MLWEAELLRNARGNRAIPGAPSDRLLGECDQRRSEHVLGLNAVITCDYDLSVKFISNGLLLLFL